MRKLLLVCVVVFTTAHAHPHVLPFFRTCAEESLVAEAETNLAYGVVRIRPIPLQPFAFREEPVTPRPGGPAGSMTVSMAPDWSGVEWSRLASMEAPRVIQGILTEDRVTLGNGMTLPMPRLMFRERQLLLHGEWFRPALVEAFAELRRRALAAEEQVGAWVFVSSAGKMLVTPPFHGGQNGVLSFAAMRLAFDAEMKLLEGRGGRADLVEVALLQAAYHDGPIDSMHVSALQRMRALRPRLAELSVRLITLPVHEADAVFYKTVP